MCVPFISPFLLSSYENGLACALPLTQFGVCGVCVPFVSPFLLSSNENVLACALPLTQFGVCVPFVSPFLQGYQILDGSKNIGEKNIVSICHAQKSPIILYPTALN